MKRNRFLLSFATGIGVLTSICAQAQPALPAVHGAPNPTLPSPVQVMPAVPQPPIESFLAFDAEQKEVSVSNGTPSAQFTFDLTNISSGDVTINFVQASCGCTVAKLPSQPWKLTSKESGQFSATMQLAGTPPGGSKTKTLTVNTDKGSKVLYVKSIVLPAASGLTDMDRASNQKLAMADRQAVFKGDCVKCHVDTAKDSAGMDKTGKDLYVAVCGVCHDSDHRASFVPNLHALPEPTNAEFWKNWIINGKQGTLMPAFAKSQGGILTDAQIQSLVKYLADTIPSHPAVPMVMPPRPQAAN
jgi:mono/diheme cytochrome c family protein